MYYHIPEKKETQGTLWMWANVILKPISKYDRQRPRKEFLAEAPGGTIKTSNINAKKKYNQKSNRWNWCQSEQS